MSLPEIRILTDDVANKIAAGEVIERPAAAVKELVENAIDAGAKRIDIEFNNGGKTLIKVSDDGHGMRPEQILTALEPHATSKISSANDLDTISSFGFRGEALPSIASVSKFSIKSKPEGRKVGGLVKIYAGKVLENGECAMSKGTEICVQDLFCAVPARRKFLKSDNTEAAHIIRTCKLYALAKPDISFSLAEDGHLIFESGRSKNLRARVGEIFGSEISEKLIDLSPYEAANISISGAVSKPNESWASSRNIYIFINGRPVDLRAGFSALKEAYQKTLQQGKYPAAFLFINIDPRQVDVNVHPAKREVRLKNEFAVRSAILAALVDTLENYSIADSNSCNSPKLPPCSAYQFSDEEYEESQSLKRILDSNLASAEEPQSKSGAREFAKSDFLEETNFAKPPAESLDSAQVAANIALKNLALKARQSALNSENKDPHSPAAADSRPSSSLGWKYLRHFAKKYALFETQNGSLVILSIPSAFKRINYEKIVKNFGGERPKAQSLLIPVNIEFDRSDDEVFRKTAKYFETCGFEIEPFGERFYRVCAAPTWVEFGDIADFVKDFVERAREEGFGIGKRSLSEQNFAKLAVAMSRGARIVESEFFANALLDELFACKSPMFAPDGKRTCKEILASEIKSFFGE